MLSLLSDRLSSDDQSRLKSLLDVEPGIVSHVIDNMPGASNALLKLWGDKRKLFYKAHGRGKQS